LVNNNTAAKYILVLSHPAHSDKRVLEWIF